MFATAGIGFATSLLEMAATSIGFGMVAGGWAASAIGMLLGRSRKELEGYALRGGFWSGLSGICCLCYDLLVR
jgi:hypothetical protein